MPEWIFVYGLVIVFFIALPLVVLAATKTSVGQTPTRGSQKGGTDKTL